MSKGWEKGSTRAWRTTRARVLRRDQHRCRLKLDGCTTVATHVHHVLGRGISEDDRDLVASCANCNLRTGRPHADPQPQPRTKW